MELEETKAVAQFQHKGEVFYFCSLECNRRFCEMVEETAKTFKSRDALTKDTEACVLFGAGFQRCATTK